MDSASDWDSLTGDDPISSTSVIKSVKQSEDEEDKGIYFFIQIIDHGHYHFTTRTHSDPLSSYKTALRSIIML